MNNNDKSNQGEMGDVEAQYQAGLETSEAARKARIQARKDGAKKAVQEKNNQSTEEMLEKDAKKGCAEDGAKRPLERNMKFPLNAYLGNAIYSRGR